MTEPRAFGNDQNTGTTVLSRAWFSIAVCSVPLFLFIATMDTSNPKWSLLSLLLGIVPLMLHISGKVWVRYWAFWLAIFLSLQSLLSPLLIDQDLVTLEPDTRKVIVVESGIPGIHGRQVITTDHMGFRTTKTIDYSDDSSLRFFAIGGSTTEQIYLDDRKTWTHLMQEKLQKELSSTEVEVVNAGVSGLRSKNHLATLAAISRLHPDIVLFMVGINDWNHHVKKALSGYLTHLRRRALRAFFIKYTLLGTGISALSRKIKAVWSEKPEPIVVRGEFYNDKRGSLYRRSRKVEFMPNRVDPEYEAVLNAISKKCKSMAVKCVFVTQPTGYRPGASEEFRRGFWMTPPGEDYTLTFDSLVHLAGLYNSYLVEFGNREGHPVCDIAPNVPASYKYLYDDCHFNEKGAVLVAGLLSRCMEDKVAEAGRTGRN